MESASNSRQIWAAWSDHTRWLRWLPALSLAFTCKAARADTPIVVPQIVAIHPHDPAAYTQGLVLHEGQLFESTGLLGASTLRRSDPETGEVTQTVSLPTDQFGEGLAVVDDRLIQLTYRNGVAHVYDVATLEKFHAFSYEGEGWGLCYDGRRLVMSDGTDQLVFRDPETFEEIGRLGVTIGGVAYSQLNELECVGSEVWANVFPTNFIVRIDATTGEVLARIDATGLLSSEEAAGADALNGIAFDATTGRFFLTGKLWPRLFEVDGLRPDEVSKSTSTSSSCSIEPAPTFGTGAWGALLWIMGLLRWRRSVATASRRAAKSG